eukprot:TRINITY_DN4021_c0_g1_i7.p3 TRINITY_DN4021_c0_g1~~TRINITY_DN4021_c0_g1_i7.p3  ORF type:complete len:136 (+),score=24.66 TRINITY_DN4021_c0_g1_i7:902-1309(+)
MPEEHSVALLRPFSKDSFDMLIAIQDAETLNLVFIGKKAALEGVCTNIIPDYSPKETRNDGIKQLTNVVKTMQSNPVEKVRVHCVFVDTGAVSSFVKAGIHVMGEPDVKKLFGPYYPLYDVAQRAFNDQNVSDLD